MLKDTICKWPWIRVELGLPWWLRQWRICLQRGWPGFNPCKEGDQEDSLEKGMATYFSILAWRILWTEEPSGLQFMGLQRIDTIEWLSLSHTHTHIGFRGGKMGWKKAFKTWKYYNKHSLTENMGLLWWFGNKEFTCNAGDVGSIYGLERSPEGGHGNPLLYSCWKNSVDRGAWQAPVQGVVKSGTWLKRLSTHTHTVIWGSSIVTDINGESFNARISL